MTRKYAESFTTHSDRMRPDEPVSCPESPQFPPTVVDAGEGDA